MSHRPVEPYRSRIRGIVLSTDAYFPVIDGVVRIIDEMRAYYTAQNIPTYVWCPRYPNYKDGESDIVRFQSIPVSLHPFRLALPVYYRKKIRAVNPDDIDIVHVHSPSYVGMFSRHWARRHKKPVVFTFHSQYQDKLKNIFKTPWLIKQFYDVIIRFANKCDVITIPTVSFRNLLISHGIHPEKCVVIPHGVPDMPVVSETDTARIEAHPIIRTIGERASADTPILLYVGQLIREKNPDLLVRTLHVLKKNVFPFYAVFVGGGDQDKPLRALVNELGLANDVLFTGVVPDKALVHAIYERATLFTFPSTYETQGMVIFEAAQHGVPTVGIDKATGISDFVVDGVTGYLSAKDPIAYAEAIMKALRDPKTLQYMRAAVKNEFPIAISDMIVAFENIYARLLTRQMDN